MILALIAPCLLAALGGDEPATPEMLAGEWAYEAVSSSGKDRPAEEIRNLRLVVARDGSFDIHDGERKVAEGRFLVAGAGDPPGALDRRIAGRSEFSGRFEPVYRQKGLARVEGDRLTLCFARDPDDPRPDKLAAPAAEGVVREVLRRRP